MKEIITSLKNQGINLKPMNDKTILLLENRFGNKFPTDYRSFLSSMGNGAGKFMLGSSAFGKELLELTECGKELSEENNLPPLPSDAFVFWMHQGYQMAFFLFSDGDNPPVYTFSEGKKQTDYIREDSIATFFNIQLQLSKISLQR